MKIIVVFILLFNYLSETQNEYENDYEDSTYEDGTETVESETEADVLDIEEAVTTEKPFDDLMIDADELTTEAFIEESDQTSPTVEDYYDIDEKSTPSPIDHRPLKPVDIPVKVFTTKRHISVSRIERKLFNKAVPIIVIVVHLVLAAIVVLVLRFKKF